MSHSKRNTSRSVFTSYERDLAKAAWAPNSARLNRDSFLSFGSCYLCLEVARDPVACSHGDIFCRECAVSNLVAQKKEIKRVLKTREKLERELQDAAFRQDEEAQNRAVKDFELVQVGLAPGTAGARPGSEVEANSPNHVGKRKLVLDEDEMERILKEDRAKARRILDKETMKDKLPSFWAPSQTPGTEALHTVTTLGKQVKSVPICPASADNSEHPYTLKSLTNIVFTQEADSQRPERMRRICPSCMKTLGNASQPLLATKCGHVLCRSCVTRFVTKHATEAEGQACFVCDQVLRSSDKGGDDVNQATEEFPGLIQLRSEGTGFSARGGNKIQKQGVAFQC